MKLKTRIRKLSKLIVALPKFIFVFLQILVMEIRDFFIEFFKVTVYVTGDDGKMVKMKRFDASRIYATTMAVLTVIVVLERIRGNLYTTDALVISCLGTMGLVLGALQYKSIQMEKNTGSNISQFPMSGMIGVGAAKIGTILDSIRGVQAPMSPVS